MTNRALLNVASPIREFLIARRGFSKNKDLIRRVGRGAVWSILGAALAQGLGLGASVAAARLLGTSGYGELRILISTVELFSILASLGLGITATKHIAEFRNSDPARAGRIAGLSALTACCSGAAVAVLLAISSSWIAASALRAPHLAVELRIAALMMFFVTANGSQVGALSGFEAFKSLAIANLIRGALAFPLILIGVTAGGLRGAVTAYAALHASNYFIHQILLRREAAAHMVPISYRPLREEWAILWGFSVPALIAGMAYNPAVWWSNAMLARTRGYSEAGVFQAAFQWQIIILFFSNAFGRLCLPVLSSIASERNARKYLRFLQISLLLTAGCAAVLATAVILAAPHLLKLYGPAFTAGRKALVLIGISATLSAANIPPGFAMWSLNATGAALVFALLPAAYLVIGASLLVHVGAVGLAWAYLITNALHAAIVIPFILLWARRVTRRWTELVPA